MNNQKPNYATGVILIVLGLVIFGITNDFFELDVTIRQIARFWPLFIVAAGLAVLLNEKKTVYNPLTALLIAFAIPLGIYHTSSNAIDSAKSEISDELNIDFDDDEDDNKKDTSSVFNVQQTVTIPVEKGVETVNLDFKGGAAEFFLSESKSENVFEAESNNIRGLFEVDDKKNGNTHDISVDMEMKNRNFKMGNKDFNNEVKLKLDKKPFWNIDLSIGAGKLDFDLSDYKVKNLDLNTGAADVSLKLGSKLAESSINIDSGVAKINLEVPKNVGCQVRMEGVLNDKEFNGFSKVSPGLWQTDNYKNASNKIEVKLNSGLSVIEINRY
jgi:Domain of unknown function (DUF5668)